MRCGIVVVATDPNPEAFALAGLMMVLTRLRAELGRWPLHAFDFRLWKLFSLGTLSSPHSLAYTSILCRLVQVSIPPHSLPYLVRYPYHHYTHSATHTTTTAAFIQQSISSNSFSIHGFLRQPVHLLQRRPGHRQLGRVPQRGLGPAHERAHQWRHRNDPVRYGSSCQRRAEFIRFSSRSSAFWSCLRRHPVHRSASFHPRASF